MVTSFYYIDESGEERGPLDGSSVKLLIDAGRIRAHTPLRTGETENFSEAHYLVRGFTEEQRRRKPFQVDPEVDLPRWSLSSLASWWSAIAVVCVVGIGVLAIPKDDTDVASGNPAESRPIAETIPTTETPPQQPGPDLSPALETESVSSAVLTDAEVEALDRYFETESIGSVWKNPYGGKSAREEEHNIFSGALEMDAIIANEREQFEREGGFN